MLEVALFQNELYPITNILILGDYADAYNISLHPKLPSGLQVSPRKLTDELCEVHYHLTELRNLFPKAKITYLEGNHEFRLARYITAKCIELNGLIKLLPEYLHFKSLKIDWLPYGRDQIFKFNNVPLYARHEPFNGGKHCALGSLDRAKISHIFGHTHRKQSATIQTAIKEEISAYSMGNLVNSKSEIFDYMDHDDWSQGFGFVFIEGGDWHLDYVDIKNGKACYHGTMYGS